MTGGSHQIYVISTRKQTDTHTCHNAQMWTSNTVPPFLHEHRPELSRAGIQFECDNTPTPSTPPLLLPSPDESEPTVVTFKYHCSVTLWVVGKLSAHSRDWINTRDWLYYNEIFPRTNQRSNGWNQMLQSVCGSGTNKHHFSLLKLPLSHLEHV